MDWLRTIIELVALIFTAIQILLLSMQIKNAIKWNKLNSTFIQVNKLSECLKNMNSELVEKIGLLKADDEPVDIEVFKNLLDNPSEASELFNIMHFFETFSISVLSGYINENIAKRVCFINITKSYKKLKPYILLRSQKANAEMYQHFQKLYDKWNSEGLNLPKDNYDEVKK